MLCPVLLELTVATTNTALQALCNYRSAPVAAPFGQKPQYAHFCSNHQQENECHWKKSDTTKNNPALIMRNSCGP